MASEVTSANATDAVKRVAALALFGLCLAIAGCGDDDDAAGGVELHLRP